MIIDRIDYKFGIRDCESVAINIEAIFKGVGYLGVDKKEIESIYAISEDMDKSRITDIKSAVGESTLRDSEKINKAIEALSQMWNEVKDRFLSCVVRGLDLKLNESKVFNSYCYLHALPINELDRSSNIIYLDYNRPIDELFKNFIVLVAKAILLDKWDNLNGDVFSHSYQAQNRLWLFADIAIDAIFACTDLCKLCDKPSYRFFYNLKINNVLFMFNFRKLYKKVEVDEFLNQVYLFVYYNQQSLNEFKNCLY